MRLDLIHAIAPHPAHRDARTLAIAPRTTCPSLAGLSPSPESRIARSTAPTSVRSHTCTVSSRGSGTPIVPTWVIGTAVPYASTRTGSSSPGLARPVRNPANSLRNVSIAPSIRRTKSCFNSFRSAATAPSST
jgi:hypothetical protein